MKRLPDKDISQLKSLAITLWKDYPDAEMPEIWLEIITQYLNFNKPKGDKDDSLEARPKAEPYYKGMDEQVHRKTKSNKKSKSKSKS